MHFIAVQSYDIAEGKALEFQEWLAANEKELAANCPDGVEYMGTFVAIYSSTPAIGAWRSMWRFDSYGAQDAFAAAMKQDGIFAKLMSEAVAFGDNRNDARTGAELLKAAVDASIWQ